MRTKRMRNIFIALLICATTSASPVEELIGTQQFMLISQFKCLTLFETHVIPSSTVRGMSFPKRTDADCNPLMRTHLIRDPTEVHPPRLLLVWPKARRVRFHILDFNGLNIKRNTSESFLLETNDLSSNVGQGDLFDMAEPYRMHTVFDWMSRVLYVIYYHLDGSQYMRVMHFKDPFKPHDMHTRILHSELGNVAKMKAHPNNAMRTQWAEDPYDSKVYYVTQKDDTTTLYVSPISKMFTLVLDGENGNLVGTLRGTPFVAVSGGLLFVRFLEDLGNVKRISSSVRSVDQNETSFGYNFVMQFDYPLPLPAIMSTIIVKNWDYCMFRDGSSARKEICDAEKLEWMRSKGMIVEDSPIDIVKWLLVAVVILSFLIVLLFVYIYWLRSTFATADDRCTRNSEFHEEASVFISKQRSFPTAYDPNSADISVDRWK
ncbi:unnamed protein product [Caenorhabditis auriculariae]|uniref:Uncharacterized protein n=1 Tax=Caenorhabditis auriculariae TaxID=2777116 RepID=A0A8S1HF96_9PELO|nr:unnamed protein product [Caenorhabditis auriculariae]